jgi:hypothetical protein
MDYTIQGPTKTCCRTGRVLQAGDTYHAELLEVDGELQRRDYAPDAWTGPSPEGIAHWVGKVPVADTPRKPVIDDNLLLDCFDHLAGAETAEKQAFRFVVSLLLMRKKKLRFEDHKRRADGTDTMVLYDPRTGTRHEVFDPRLDETALATTQADVFKLLGWSE